METVLSKPSIKCKPFITVETIECNLLESYSSLTSPPPVYFVFSPTVAKSLQSCLTLCSPIDGSSPGSPVSGILQARALEWVAISFSNAWKWKVKMKSLSRVRPSVTPWTAAHQAPLSMGFSRQEYWSGVPLPSLLETWICSVDCLHFVQTFSRLQEVETSWTLLVLCFVSALSVHNFLKHPTLESQPPSVKGTLSNSELSLDLGLHLIIW